MRAARLFLNDTRARARARSRAGASICRVCNVFSHTLFLAPPERSTTHARSRIGLRTSRFVFSLVNFAAAFLCAQTFAATLLTRRPTVAAIYAAHDFPLAPANSRLVWAPPFARPPLASRVARSSARLHAFCLVCERARTHAERRAAFAVHILWADRRLHSLATVAACRSLMR